MNKIHNINNISFDGTYICLFVDGEYYKIDLKKQSKKLANSPDKIKYNYELSPSGYGIHWPDIDEDLSIDGLISNNKNKKNQLSIKEDKIAAPIV